MSKQKVLRARRKTSHTSLPNFSEAVKTTLRDYYIARKKTRTDKGEGDVGGRINNVISTKGDASGSDGTLFDVFSLKEKYQKAY